MEKRTVLVVDDERMWRDILGRLFSGEGYKVLAAASCAEAVALIRASRPDCVILDFNLSDGDSLPVCAEIRARGGPRIPVVMFSSDPAAGECAGLEHGADMFFKKTAPLEELLGAVKALLAARYARR